MLLYQILACTTHGKIEKTMTNIKFKISALAWNEKFDLPDRSYSVSDIQNYFEYIFKKHEEKTSTPSVTIYVNRIEKRIIFKIKTGIILNFKITWKTKRWKC